MDELILKIPFKVTSAETDMNARMRPGAMVNLLVQAAISSADKLAAGFEEIRHQQLFWVLSRISVEIKKPLKWYESCEVETWPKDVERILYLRDFVIRDEENQTVALATSGWLAVDLVSKRPRTLNGIQYDIFRELRGKHAINALPEKLFPLNGGAETKEIPTTYYDIDLNGHVTAVRYIDWMMDSFDVDFHKIHYPSAISMNYLNETKPGETIKLLKVKGEEDTFLFEGINLNRNVAAFRGKVRW